MTEKAEGEVAVPGWLFRWGLGAVQAALSTALAATIAWAWNTEGRVSDLEAERTTIRAELASAQARLQEVNKHDTEIEVLKTELKYIRTGIDEVKVLVRNN